MIQACNLTKAFGDFVAVEDLSFKVNKGDILAFLGPNGAGKSTTMKMLTGYLTPNSGHALIMGVNIQKDPIKAKGYIGYLPESTASYKSMTVVEFLRFMAEVRGLKGDQIQSRVEAVMKQTHLTQVATQTIETLSKGFRQRVGFAQALVHDPPVLILDEPTDGLDPNQKHEMRNLIKSMSENKAVILSTHILEEMEALATRCIIIDEGKIVFDGTPAELILLSKSHHEITITFESEIPQGLDDQIKELEGVSNVSSNKNNQLTVHPTEGQNLLHSVNHFLQDHHSHILEIHLEKGQMEEVFRNLTAGELV
ncbi:MAG: ABC transporter ATP-binding protein [SAR324 cluster bacterium]|nr:ABC transporter ATP-binding protein [SAR324 cluster bacterium]